MMCEKHIYVIIAAESSIISIYFNDIFWPCDISLHNWLVIQNCFVGHFTLKAHSCSVRLSHVAHVFLTWHKQFIAIVIYSFKKHINISVVFMQTF